MHDDEAVDLPTAIPGAQLQGVAIAAGVVPFFFSVGSTSTVNGQVVSHIDYVAIGGGGIALLLGIAGLVGALKASDPGRQKRMGLAVLALLLGLYHLATGTGLLLL